MSRPKKCRKVCRMPIADRFEANSANEGGIVLSIDEYECIRLLDYQGFSQEESAQYMQVSRATVQLIYDSARKKLATALVNGYTIRIDGGDYKLCEGNEDHCNCGGCRKHCNDSY